MPHKRDLVVLARLWTTGHPISHLLCFAEATARNSLVTMSTSLGTKAEVCLFHGGERVRGSEVEPQ